MREPITAKRLKLWLRWVAIWALEPKLLWLTVAVLVCAFAIGISSNCGEPRIRLTGLSLQLLGMATVIWGIRSTGQLFGRPTLIEAAVSWLKRFPSYQPRILATTGTATATASASARASVTAGVPENPSIEDRVRALERNLQHVRQDIVGVEAALDQAKAEFRMSLAAESDKRQDEVTSLRKRMEAAHTGGLYMAAMGTTWLFVGICLGTASVELSRVCG